MKEDKEKFSLFSIETSRENQINGLLNSSTIKNQVYTEPSYSSHRTRPYVNMTKHHQLALHYPGFSFSKITRFDSNIYEKFKNLSPIFRSSSNKSKEFNKEKISKNKIMKNFSPVEKSLRIKTLSMQGQSHRTKIKLRRDQIFKSIQISKQEKLMEKFRRFEIRHNKTDSLCCKIAWSLLVSASGMIFIFRNAVENKKKRKKKALSYLFWIKSISKCSVLMIKIARSVRKKLALRRITRSVKKMKNWLGAVRLKNYTIIFTSLDNMLIKSSFIDYLITWKYKIVFIQRALRKALKTRRTLINTLLNQWEYTEHFVLYQKHRTRSKKRKGADFKSNIPIAIKISLIKQKIRDLTHNYITKMRNYKVILNMHKDCNDRQTNLILEYSPGRPFSPDIIMEFTPEVFKKLIQNCLKIQLRSKKSTLIQKP